MEGVGEQLEATNVNDLWLKNIYENIVKAEDYYRRSGEGAELYREENNISLQHWAVIEAPYRLKMIKLLCGELLCLLADSNPQLDEKKRVKWVQELKNLKYSLKNDEKKYINTKFSASQNRIVASNVTDHFEDTHWFLYYMRTAIIKELQSLFFVNKGKETENEVVYQ